MPCTPFRDGKVWGFICSRGRRQKGPTCSVKGCANPSHYQCDHPITPRTIHGKLQTTCNRWLCDEHRTPVGKDVDHCPFHASGGPYRAAGRVEPNHAPVPGRAKR